MAHSIPPGQRNRFRPRASVLSTPEPVVVVPVRRRVVVAVRGSQVPGFIVPGAPAQNLGSPS